MDYETLLYERDAHVVTLTYNRPDQHNAVNRTMNSELRHAWERFRDDDDAFVLVITGAEFTVRKTFELVLVPTTSLTATE